MFAIALNIIGAIVFIVAIAIGRQLWKNRKDNAIDRARLDRNAHKAKLELARKERAGKIKAGEYEWSKPNGQWQ